MRAGAVLGSILLTGTVLAVGLASSPGAAAAHRSPLLSWATATVDEVAATELALGVRSAALSTYADFTEPFPAEWAAAARDRGVALVVSWEPWDSDLTTTAQPGFALRSIAAGGWDPYLRQWARDAAGAGTRVLVRFAPEMNGDWLVWSDGANGSTASDYRRAWRHVHRVFEEEGAANVRWVFNPVIVEAETTPLESFWPGSRYVDWLAVDGYNWAGYRGRTYADARTVFAATVSRLRTLHPSAPVMIAETGATPQAKAAWIPDLARTAVDLGIDLVVWFERDKEVDWRMTSGRLTEPLPAILGRAGWRVRVVQP